MHLGDSRKDRHRMHESAALLATRTARVASKQIAREMNPQHTRLTSITTNGSSSTLFNVAKVLCTNAIAITPSENLAIITGNVHLYTVMQWEGALKLHDMKTTRTFRQEITTGINIHGQPLRRFVLNKRIQRFVCPEIPCWSMWFTTFRMMRLASQQSARVSQQRLHDRRRNECAALA